MTGIWSTRRLNIECCLVAARISCFLFSSQVVCNAGLFFLRPDSHHPFRNKRNTQKIIRKVVPSLPACEFSRNSPRRSEGHQGATPRARSASTTPSWTASPRCMDDPHTALYLSSCNATLEGCLHRVTPTGPLRGGVAASTPQQFRVFVPRRSALVGPPPVPKHTAPAPVHRRGTHNSGCPGWPSQFWVWPGWCDTLPSQGAW